MTRQLTNDPTTVGQTSRQLVKQKKKSKRLDTLSSNSNGSRDVGDRLRVGRVSSSDSLQDCTISQSHLSMTPTIDTAATSENCLSATEYKNFGNKLCSSHRFDEAIIYYTKAISKNPEVPSYFSNRALCHLKLQQWSSTIEDCRRALDLDSDSIKANFFLGQALAETGNYDESLKHLERANELALANKMNFGDDITYQIRLTKRRRWSKIEEDTEVLESELMDYITNLIRTDINSKIKSIDNRLQEIRGGGATTSDQSSSSNSQVKPGASDEESKLETQRLEFESKCDIYTDKIRTIFRNLKLQRKRRDVPDYLCGKISFEIMHDPVITPSGITYDRKDIEEHLRRVGHFDPITRQPLKSSQLISNLAMKEIIDAYIKDNEWALYY